MQIFYVERDEFNALLGLKDTHNFIYKETPQGAF